MSRGEWNVIRRDLFGKPRRLSVAFLRKEREEMEFRRNYLRREGLYHLAVGDKVIVDISNDFRVGVILACRPSEYLIQFSSNIANINMVGSKNERQQEQRPSDSDNSHVGWYSDLKVMSLTREFLDSNGLLYELASAIHLLKWKELLLMDLQELHMQADVFNRLGQAIPSKLKADIGKIITDLEIMNNSQQRLLPSLLKNQPPPPTSSSFSNNALASDGMISQPETYHHPMDDHSSYGDAVAEGFVTNLLNGSLTGWKIFTKIEQIYMQAPKIVLQKYLSKSESGYNVENLKLLAHFLKFFTSLQEFVNANNNNNNNAQHSESIITSATTTTTSDMILFHPGHIPYNVSSRNFGTIDDLFDLFLEESKTLLGENAFQIVKDALATVKKIF